MKYAIVLQNGKQYKVTEGEDVQVDHVASLKPQDTYEFNDILLVSNGEKRYIGTPLVAGAKVKGTVITQGKGQKIRVAKFKAKARYRRVRGFRPRYTLIKIESISLK